MHTLDVPGARRLALARSGLLKPEWTGFPTGSGRGDRAARDAAFRAIARMGYLQLDTVSIAGARSHAIVLHSRLGGFETSTGEELLRPGAPLFEYWGHEASWLPISLYPVFEFRRQEFAHHPWWGDVAGNHPEATELVRRRLREEGPLRSADFDGANRGGWWNIKVAGKILTHLWSSGEVAVRERRGFQRTYDLTERVIPAALRDSPLPEPEALDRLVLLALEGHGWATGGTLARTWRLRNRASDLRASIERLRASGAIVPCTLVERGDRRTAGWVRPTDLELVERLRRVRPRPDAGVLLSPFDPVLWERDRVSTLFGFDQVLEIFKPEAQRVYGYYCLPVLAGEALVARVDLKADRRAGLLRVLSCRFEGSDPARGTPVQTQSVRSALARFGASVGLEPIGGP